LSVFFPAGSAQPIQQHPPAGRRPRIPHPPIALQTRALAAAGPSDAERGERAAVYRVTGGLLSS
jgi:hypothetical protein